MGHACTHDHFRAPDKEHPVVAWIAVIAIAAAMLLIGWARLELHGTDDIEAAFSEPMVQGDLPLAPRLNLQPDEEREVDAAVTSSRFATGFSP